ncbi:hypothetical protein COLO4_02371 [Corchorus olitorius]|uniref:Uncharacterized protein n=1 Tax=Corchorus olitorius TaxID=93759 RepID=A0A1R3L126_9ROSI|nr:hypothetical protein COLO4_02371 [Corchorus olitorius]
MALLVAIWREWVREVELSAAGRSSDTASCAGPAPDAAAPVTTDIREPRIRPCSASLRIRNYRFSGTGPDPRRVAIILSSKFSFRSETDGEREMHHRRHPHRPRTCTADLKHLLHEEAERIRLIGRKSLDLHETRLAVKPYRLRLADAGFETNGRKAKLLTTRDERIHDQLADAQTPRLRIDEHALDLSRAIARFHQRPAADHAATLPHHEKRDIILLKRADIDQMIAFCGVKRRHIGIGKVDEAQNRVLTGCLKLDLRWPMRCLPFSQKSCVFRRNVTAIGIR